MDNESRDDVATAMESMRAKWRTPFSAEKKAEDTKATAARGGAAPTIITARGAGWFSKPPHTVPNDKTIAAPSQEFTKVDPSVTVLCANLSQQIYGATSAKDFNLSVSPTKMGTMVLFDDHGDLNPAVPAVAVAAVDDTIVVAWRGTNQLLDVVTDLGVAPVVSPLLGAAAGGSGGQLRTQGMFSAIVASDLQLHERTIVKYIKTHQITQIVFTGHSLGGGLASVGHLFVKAQIDGGTDNNNNAQSVWHGLSRLTCYTVAFAAPMAMFHLPASGGDKKNTASEQLLRDVGKNSCNFVFNCDVVPRGYSHTDYIYDVIEAVASEVARENNPLPLNVGSRLLTDAVLGVVRKTAQESLPVAVKYRHYGRLLYYASAEQKEPIVLTDVGPKRGKKKNQLSYYTYDSYNIEKNYHTEALMAAHLHFPQAFATYIGNSEETNRSISSLVEI